MLVEFTVGKDNRPVSIPTNKITGFVGSNSVGKTFIATGADGVDGSENGWYVNESYEEVRAVLMRHL